MKRSVLVLGWFYAQQRELDYVRRMYKRNGFDDIVIRPSLPSIISKPRGWYRSMRRQLQPWRATVASTSDEQHLDRHFDVVHCMSGGFLALYVLLCSKVGLRFSTLLCDSTPILPKPAAFTRFARAFMASAGWWLAIPLKLLPARAHQMIVRARWTLSIFYIRTKHQLASLLGQLQGCELNRWAGAEGPVAWALAGDYDRVARHALGTIYEGAAQCEGSKLIFLYNPDDPYLDAADVQLSASLAHEVGLPVHQVHVKADHVKALFSVPRTIFGLLTPPREGDDRGSATTVGGPPESHELETQLGREALHERISTLVRTGYASWRPHEVARAAAQPAMASS